MDIKKGLRPQLAKAITHFMIYLMVELSVGAGFMWIAKSNYDLWRYRFIVRDMVLIACALGGLIFVSVVKKVIREHRDVDKGGPR